jgi:hypothetical protein
MACCSSCANGGKCELSKSATSKPTIKNMTTIKKAEGQTFGARAHSGQFTKKSMWKYGFTYPLMQEQPGEAKAEEMIVSGTSAPDLYLLPGSSGIQGLGSPALSSLSFPRNPRGKVKFQCRQVSQVVTTGGDRVW